VIRRIRTPGITKRFDPVFDGNVSIMMVVQELCNTRQIGRENGRNGWHLAENGRIGVYQAGLQNEMDERPTMFSYDTPIMIPDLCQP
jgi:hypothetical protein